MMISTQDSQRIIEKRVPDSNQNRILSVQSLEIVALRFFATTATIDLLHKYRLYYGHSLDAFCRMK